MLAMYEFNDIEKVIHQHQQRFKISLPIMKQVVSEIEQRPLREAALSVLSKLK
jgi:hypothetical protein